ncbi:hypothetical protein [Epilithonimonas sp.]|uniref:hypothetical protein n=1 Tax=Epilithonimonas sp. TaxID=2894511 RepID=UPI00289D553E|nr:hypothetical protein [Epilithonimonas sp.]
MIDKIKCYAEDVRLSDEILKTKFKKSYNSRNGNEVYLFDHFNSIFVKKNKIERSQSIDEEEGYINNVKRQNLYVLFIRPIGSNKGKIIFNQNIRKNWINYNHLQFGRGSEGKHLSPMYDLKFKDFVKIIDLYADELSIPKNVFWNATITQLELGANLKFDTRIRKGKKLVGTMNLNKMLSCFGRLKNVEEKHTYGSYGICFKAKNFELSIYDKLNRIVNTREIFKKSGERIKSKNRLKLSRVAFFLRYELRILSMSHFNQSAFENRIGTLKELKDNWNEVLIALFETTEDIEFYDFLSPEIETELMMTGLKSKGLEKFKNLMIYNGLKMIGYQNFKDFVVPLVNSKVRTKFETEILQVNSEFRDLSKYGNSYQKKFLNALENKLKSLRVS